MYRGLRAPVTQCQRRTGAAIINGKPTRPGEACGDPWPADGLDGECRPRALHQNPVRAVGVDSGSCTKRRDPQHPCLLPRGRKGGPFSIPTREADMGQRKRKGTARRERRSKREQKRRGW